MDPVTTSGELPAFGEFVQLLTGQGKSMTAEEAVVAFRRYQEQLAQFKKETQPAVDAFDAGLGSELDIYQILEQAKQQLADEGIAD